MEREMEKEKIIIMIINKNLKENIYIIIKKKEKDII